MAHIFISYSRKDRAFATRLFDALEASGRDAWLDAKDIPPTAEWMTEIERSIEGADAFVFIISPDSLRSEICARELDHAITHHKRLVPVVWREPAGEKVSPNLQKLNWIFFRTEDSFEQAFSNLQNALDTDLDYVRAHTRLMVRAREWQGKNRSGSFALRGEDLREAESWLAEGAEKKPNPAQLQVEYITFSRQVESVRQRRTLSAVLAALVITTGLAIFAFWQSQIATSREHARATSQAIAEEERRIALSGKLASQSRLLFDEQLDLALLLAVLSGQINPTSEASSALHDALEHRPDLVQYLNGVPSGGVTQMAYTSDGGQLIAVGTDSSIWRWDMSTGELMGDPIRKADQFVLDITLGPQDEIWVTSLNETGVFIWEASSGELPGPQIPFSEDQDGDGRPELPNIVALSPDGNTLATAVWEEVWIWDVRSGQLLGKSNIPLGFPPSALEFSFDGKTLASAGNEWQIYFWDAINGKSVGVWPTGHTRNITSLTFSADGRFIASGSEDGTVNLFDLETGEQRMRQPNYSITTNQEIPPPALGHPAAVRSLVLSPDGELLVSGAEDGNMLIWDTNTMTPYTVFMPAYVGPIRALAYDPGSKFFAVGGGNNSITIWHPDVTWRLTRPKSETDLEINFLHEWTQVENLPAQNDSSSSPVQENLRVKHIESGILAVGGCATTVDRYEPCPKGSVQAYQADGQLIDLQPADLAIRPETLSFNSDGTMLAVAACPSEPGYDCSSSEIWVWSLPGGQVKSWVTSVARINRLLFSPDGRYLAYGGEGKDVMLFNLESDREIRLSLLNLPGELTGLAFNPDGTRLAAGASYQDPGPYANTIQHSKMMIWETGSGQVIAHADLHGATTGDLAFSEDGRFLEYFTVEGSGFPFNIWPLGMDQWQELACRIANRNLTETEWQRYVIGEEYRQICP